jgi:hypothetical protein
VRSTVVIGAAALALGVLMLPAGPAGAQSQGRTTGATIREDMRVAPAPPKPGPPTFGSVPSARERIRIETRDLTTGVTRETRITIEEVPTTAGASLTPGPRTGFGSVPSFDRQIRITTEGAPTVTRVEVPIIIPPRP